MMNRGYSIPHCSILPPGLAFVYYKHRFANCVKRCPWCQACSQGSREGKKQNQRKGNKEQGSGSMPWRQQRAHCSSAGADLRAARRCLPEEVTPPFAPRLALGAAGAAALAATVAATAARLDSSAAALSSWPALCAAAAAAASACCCCCCCCAANRRFSASHCASDSACCRWFSGRPACGEGEAGLERIARCAGSFV